MLHGWEHLTQADRRVILDGIRDGAVYGGPFHAEFSPTDACNYECFFCNSAFVDRSKRLPWDVLRRTLLELIGMGVRSVRLAGGGEPLIYPQIREFLDICLENRVAISNITTNAYKLTPEVIERVLKIDTTEIIVSFNDVDPERYASTNGTTARAFNVVLDNVRNLLAARRARGLKRPMVVLQFFVWKGNHAQVERAYEIAEELGVDHVYLRDMHGIERSKVMTRAELEIARKGVQRLVDRDAGRGFLLLNFSNEKVVEEQKTLSEQAKEYNGTGIMNGEANGAGNGNGGAWRPVWRMEHPDRKEYCYIAWHSMVIRGNGEVFPCCMLAATPGYPPLGNVNHAPIGEIWRGENYGKLRSELREFAVNGGRYDHGGGHCFTYEYCAMKDACPFVASLATPEFYQEVLGELETVRRKPLTAARLAAQNLKRARPFIGAGK